MSVKIIGVTVGTPTSPMAMAEKLKPVTSINGQTPDENGNVEIEVGAGSEQNVTLDTTLTQSGAAADAKATGDRITQVEGKIPTKPADIGADPAGAASEAINSHNTDLAAHPYFHERCNDLEGALGDKLDASKLPEAINTALTGYATEDWVRQGYQPKGSYLTEGMLDSAIEDALDEAATSGKFDGADGKTPVKGVDYFTAADQAEMVQSVVAALPKYAGEVEIV